MQSWIAIRVKTLAPIQRVTVMEYLIAVIFAEFVESTEEYLSDFHYFDY